MLCFSWKYISIPTFNDSSDFTPREFIEPPKQAVSSKEVSKPELTSESFINLRDVSSSSGEAQKYLFIPGVTYGNSEVNVRKESISFSDAYFNHSSSNSFTFD